MTPVKTMILWGPVVVYMAFIFYVSSMPEAPLPPGFTDKPTHSLGYAGLAVLVVRAFAGGLPSRIAPPTALAAIAVTVAYGATDEVHQMFVPGRSAEIADLYADAIGACAGAFACWAWGIIFASDGL